MDEFSKNKTEAKYPCVDGFTIILQNLTKQDN